ncbi:hypothetical protein DSL72_001514 [Monilinia vaccinii-corymbosi]|uniref:Uncharacterized protein n=1 Tax=Monilinia vaccinii-corymbosi TaxID=61207 RepID=A0A8A3P231_9HELO|nr:hypothetical protein DSL72_001514 [Monilinia vaccinii-corymbosi]
MSPTGIAFQKQVDTLLNEVSDCIRFCHQIRETRRLGSKHENFDNLLNHLLASHTSLSTKYDTLKQCFGHWMDVGDEASVVAMKKCLRALSSDIKRKLLEISNKTVQTTGTRQLPGFNALLQHWKLIEEDASNIIISLSKRLIITPPASIPIPPPTASLNPEFEIRSDQQAISDRSFKILISHMQDSWIERWSNERLIYVNCYDEQNRTYEKPAGFIKPLSASYRPANPETLAASRSSDEHANERERRAYAYGWSTRIPTGEYRRP